MSQAMRQRLVNAPICHPSPKMAKKDEVYQQGSPCQPLSQPNEALNMTQDSHHNTFKKVMMLTTSLSLAPKYVRLFTQRKLVG
jgi:hypothetical protein